MRDEHRKLCNQEAFKYGRFKDDYGVVRFRLTGVNENGVYIVYSYGHHWPLFIHKNGVWYENSSRSTRTTNRQRVNFRPRANTCLVDIERMLEMASAAREQGIGVEGLSTGVRWREMMDSFQGVGNDSER